MPPRGSPKKTSPSGKSNATARAAQVLAKARAAAASTPAASASAAHAAARQGNASGSGSGSGSGSSSSKLPGFSALPGDTSIESEHDRTPEKATPIPLPQLLKQMTSYGLTMHEAMPIAGKLIKGGFALPDKISLLSPAALNQLGIDAVETQKKVIAAFGGKRTAIMLKAAGEGNAADRPTKRRRRGGDDEEALSREWGNVAGPSGRKATSTGTAVDYVFHETLAEEDIRGRYVFVNRAPVMTAWATIVLERLGFSRVEALSIAHCYVAHTSTARGVSLGILPASARDKAVNVVGPTQPHFELMGVKIPVMQVEGGQWRGISGGECIEPDRAFNYMRKSMFQTLPLVIGALTLLADSYLVDPPPKGEEDSETAVKADPDGDGGDAGEASDQPTPSDRLHAKAYSLYTQFRPETGGEWGKRARFELDKVLALRLGHEEDWQNWLTKEEGNDHESRDVKIEQSGDGGEADTDTQEADELRRDIEEAILEQERQEQSDGAIPSSAIKQEEGA